jgi:hypothetical protein
MNCIGINKVVRREARLFPIHFRNDVVGGSKELIGGRTGHHSKDESVEQRGGPAYSCIEMSTSVCFRNHSVSFCILVGLYD